MHQVLYCFQDSLIYKILLHPKPQEATLPIREPADMDTHLGAGMLCTEAELSQPVAERSMEDHASYLELLLCPGCLLADWVPNLRT